MGFVHLHTHTEHSFLDGASTLTGLAERTAQLGQRAVAITDHGEVSGHLKFQKACHTYGVQPIFGMEAYFVDDVTVRTGRSNSYGHSTLLATSQVGLTNLWKLASRAYIEGFYYKPRLDWNILKDHTEGIIATSGCLGGFIANHMIEGEDQYDPGLADERISKFIDILGDQFYIELHTFPDEKQRQVNRSMVEMGSTFGVPMIAVSDSHYLRPEEWEDHEQLIAAGMYKGKTKKDGKAGDPAGYKYGAGALYFMEEEEVFKRLSSHLPDEIVRTAMDNTVEIANRSEGVEVLGQRTYPIFLNRTEQDIDQLNEDAWKFFNVRMDKLGIEGNKLEEYRERLKRELRLVIDKGYAGYFLITADVIQWAKAKGMLIGPGRGSAGGSLLSYVLGIIELDPVANGLLFERFLDPNLKSLPDIDVDVPQLERHEVLEYLRGKYHVAGIGTLNTLKPRSALNDFCRVLKISHEDTDAIHRVLNEALGDEDLKWSEAYEYGKEKFAPWVKKYPRLFSLLHSFAEHYRHAGAHAAAVVVNREDLLGRLPLRIKEEEVRTQMEMGDVEELGFMKMDFLGLRTLSTLMRAMEMANQSWTPGSGKPEPKHFYEWQYENEKYYGDLDVYKSLWDGKNLGVFQIETEGISEVTRRYLPQSLEDMCAIVSLYRPGITRAIDDETKLNLLELGLQKREGKVGVTYRHPLLEPILKNTYGSFLYQEQIMQVVRDIGDFSPEDQTKVRKAIGKKTGLEKFKVTFIDNAQAKGMAPETAEIIWNDMEKFGEYGFNKSHGFAYGMIAYWTAWVKHHYPMEFLTALFQTNEEEKKAYNRECRRLDIPLLGPDVNESKTDFALVRGRIRYGFLGIKGIADKSAEAIEKNAPYSSAIDLVTRLEGSKANKKAIESLARVGAMDSIVTDDDREGLPPTWSPSKVALYRLHRGKLKIGVRKDKGLDEQGIFRKYLPEFQELVDECQIDDLDFNEVDLLGEHVETMPFGKWMDLISEHYRYPGYKQLMTDEKAILGGTVNEIRTFKVKKKGKNEGKYMAQVFIEFPVIEDGKVIDIESQKLVCFPHEWVFEQSKIEEGAPVIVKVQKLADRDGFEGGLSLQSTYRIDRGEFPGMHALNRVAVEDDPTQEEGFWD